MTATTATQSGRERSSAEIIQSLRGLYAKDDGPDYDARVGAWWWGANDEDVAGAIGAANVVAAAPVAKHLYLFSRGGEMAGDVAVRDLMAWCEGMAAESACTVGDGPRKRSRVLIDRGSRWWRQAGYDGAALAMWGDSSPNGEQFRDAIPGVNKRCAKYKCGPQAYQRVREYVEAEARTLLDEFKRDVEMVLSGRYDPSFRSRWESCTGTPFRRVAI